MPPVLLPGGSPPESMAALRTGKFRGRNPRGLRSSGVYANSSQFCDPFDRVPNTSVSKKFVGDVESGTNFDGREAPARYVMR